jgi:hypothetical protein
VSQKAHRVLAAWTLGTLVFASLPVVRAQTIAPTGTPTKPPTKAAPTAAKDAEAANPLPRGSDT